MPEITEISPKYNRKVQLDDFEPIEVGGTATVSLEEGDDPWEVYAETYEKLEDSVERELAARVTQKKLAGGDDEDED